MMKRSLTFLFVAFFCSFCNAQNKIELNLLKGKVYQQKMSVAMAIKQNISNAEMVINMDVSGITTFTVTDVKEGVYDIDVAYKSLAMKSDIPGGQSMSFDSEKKDEKDTLSTSLALMKDKPFHMKMNRQGKILAISDVSHLYANVFEKFPNLTPSARQKLQAQMEQSFGEKAFRNNMENMTAFYPQTAVGKGGKWKVTSTTASANMDIQLENNYTLDDVTAGQYIISGVSKITSPNAGKFVELNGMSIKTDILGNVNASMKVNRKSGWVEESASNMSLKGSISIQANDKLPDGMTIPMEITGKSTFGSN